MEWRLAFVEFVFAFCAVVLADRLHGFSGRLLAAAFGGRAEKSLVAAAAASGRHDWYVRYHRGDLTGALSKAPESGQAARPELARPRRDARPRLHA